MDQTAGRISMLKADGHMNIEFIFYVKMGVRGKIDTDKLSRSRNKIIRNRVCKSKKERNIKEAEESSNTLFLKNRGFCQLMRSSDFASVDWIVDKGLESLQTTIGPSPSFGRDKNALEESTFKSYTSCCEGNSNPCAFIRS